MGIRHIALSPTNTRLYDLAGKSDEMIVEESVRHGIKKANKMPCAKIAKALPTLAIGALAVSSAAKKPGALSSKLVSGGYVLGMYAFISAVWSLFNKTTNKIKEKSPKLQKIEKKAPVLSAVSKIAGSIGVVLLATKGLGKGVSSVIKKYPDLSGKISENIKKIDTTKIGKFVEDIKPKYQAFAQKHGKLTSFFSRNNFAVILASYIGISMGLNSRIANKRDEAIEHKMEDMISRRDLAQGIVE